MQGARDAIAVILGATAFFLGLLLILATLIFLCHWLVN